MDVYHKIGESSETLYKSIGQEIEVAGGWEITGGVGLAFGKLSDPSFSYSVIDGKVTATENDEFIPFISSMAHIVKRTHSSINFGGAFGVGFPISGGNGISSATFFTGPTFVIGKEQKFILSGGVMGAKVNRLANGINVGDPFDTQFTPEVPKVSKYELGYFLSISYDIL